MARIGAHLCRTLQYTSLSLSLVSSSTLTSGRVRLFNCLACSSPCDRITVEMPAASRKLTWVAQRQGERSDSELLTQTLPIPVTIITGHLGVGKTTAIANLVKQKPASEHWAILVNEIGALGIDAAILEGSTDTAFGEHVTVKQLAGGCMCCTLAGPMTAGIAQLVRKAKPDHLIIEPSGLGHPAGLLDVLQGPHLRTSLRLHVIIALVDPSKVTLPDWLDSELVQSQIAVADVVVLNKADITAADDMAAAREYAQNLYPPKLQVLDACNAQLPLELLSIGRDPNYNVPHALGHVLPTDHGVTSSAPSSATRTGLAGAPQRSVSDDDATALRGQCLLTPRCPLRVQADESQQQGQRACGWMFHADDVFDRTILHATMALLWGLCLRVKGVFRIGKDYVILKLGVDDGVELVPLAYRRESRVEIIVGKHVASSPGAAAAPLDVSNLSFLSSDDRMLLGSAFSGIGGAGALALAVLQGDWDCVERAMLCMLKSA